MTAPRKYVLHAILYGKHTTVQGRARKRAFSYMPSRLTIEDARLWACGHGVAIELRCLGEQKARVTIGSDGSASFHGPV